MFRTIALSLSLALASAATSQEAVAPGWDLIGLGWGDGGPEAGRRVAEYRWAGADQVDLETFPFAAACGAIATALATLTDGPEPTEIVIRVRRDQQRGFLRLSEARARTFDVVGGACIGAGAEVEL